MNNFYDALQILHRNFPSHFTTHQQEVRVPCTVCLAENSDLTTPCCGAAVCDDCVNTHVQLSCTNYSLVVTCLACPRFLHRSWYSPLLRADLREKCEKVVTCLEGVGKLCPDCDHVMTRGKKRLVTCESCSLLWCFDCQTPSHPGISCKSIQAGDILLRIWAKEGAKDGSRRAQRCPKCKVLVERSGGCDVMACPMCATDFCFACGTKLHHDSLVIDHDGKWSVFGCKRLWRNQPLWKRLFLRNGAYGGQVLIGVPLAVVTVASVATVVTLTSPVWGPALAVSRARRTYNRRKEKRILEEPASIS